MKKLSYAVLVTVILLLSMFALGASKKVPFHGTTTYNKDAHWKYEECTYCSGTGYVVIKKYDKKRNRTYVHVVPCPYCKGTGKHGMSKK